MEDKLFIEFTEEELRLIKRSLFEYYYFLSDYKDEEHKALAVKVDEMENRVSRILMGEE